MADMQRSTLIRSFTKRLETLHSASYFSGAVAQALAHAGPNDCADSYLASRSASLGAVGAGPVAATFYSFSPAFVAAHVPTCWAKASPPVAWHARLVGVEAMLAELFLSLEPQEFVSIS